MKVHHLNSFLFDTATYTISDENGQSVQLVVNYKERRFSIDNQSGIDGTALSEIASIATDLLRRKSGINIAER